MATLKNNAPASYLSAPGSTNVRSASAFDTDWLYDALHSIAAQYIFSHRYQQHNVRPVKNF
jgi:hypothetical protein